MVYGLDSLRHYTVICRDNKYGYIGKICTAGAHCGKRLVSRGVKEGYVLPVQADAVSADMLGYSARFARCNVRIAYRIEQRGLAVIDVTHNDDYRCARDEILFLVLLLGK